MFQSFFKSFQTLRRYQARGFVCFQSSPFTSIASRVEDWRGVP